MQPRVVVVGLLIVAVLVVSIYTFNKKRWAPWEKPNEAVPKFAPRFAGYSHLSSYEHVAPMKHDLFKQATVEIIRNVLIVLLLGKASHWPDALLKITFGLVGFFAFYHVVEPYIANTILNF
jgi:hypothetical protein